MTSKEIMYLLSAGFDSDGALGLAANPAHRRETGETLVHVCVLHSTVIKNRSRCALNLLNIKVKGAEDVG
jgi:hypothetical protein